MRENVREENKKERKQFTECDWREKLKRNETLFTGLIILTITIYTANIPFCQ